MPDLPLPVPHHLAGGVAVHAAAEGRHAAPGHLGGVGQHPGAVCNKEALHRYSLVCNKEALQRYSLVCNKEADISSILPISSPAGVAIRPAPQSAIELSF